MDQPLNQKAEKGDIDPLIGREHEITRAIQVLCRRRKNNPLLVGEAGVGKTAIAEGLAKKIVDKLGCIGGISKEECQSLAVAFNGQGLFTHERVMQ